MQLRELRDYCERRSWTITNEYVDIGVSGSKDSRPQLNKLMAGAKQRRFDALLVWKLDRFGRSLKHLVSALGEFEALGIAFVSLRDSFDLTTPAGRLMFNMVASFAEFERDLIRERVRAGIANRRAKGFRVGRKRVSIDSTRLQALRSQGRTIREIADALGVSRSLRFTESDRLRKGEGDQGFPVPRICADEGDPFLQNTIDNHHDVALFHLRQVAELSSPVCGVLR